MKVRIATTIMQCLHSCPLMPPPPCPLVKVSFVARLGFSTPEVPTPAEMSEEALQKRVTSSQNEVSNTPFLACLERLVEKETENGVLRERAAIFEQELEAAELSAKKWQLKFVAHACQVVS